MSVKGSTTKRKAETTGVVLTQEQKEWVEAQAHAHGLSRSEVVREALEAYMNPVEFVIPPASIDYAAELEKAYAIIALQTQNILELTQHIMKRDS